MSLRHWVAKILGYENHSFWQRLNALHNLRIFRLLIALKNYLK